MLCGLSCSSSTPAAVLLQVVLVLLEVVLALLWVILVLLRKKGAYAEGVSSPAITC